ncbi:MAG: hypothetical protein J6333_08975, partial [Planctomycetes bacterium]|nr:hypothetical protein [Planctomycetota bacterium]
MRKSNFAPRPLARCAYWRLLSALAFLLSLAAVPAGGAEGVNWSSRALTLGRADVATGGYRVSRVLGVANFSPEFVMPLEAVYESASTRTGLLGYRWSCPQLESRVIPGPKPERNSDAPETAVWRAPWGEEITLIRKKDVAKGSPLAQIDAGALKHVSSAAFYAPYGDWEATRAGTSWTVKGRADRPRAGWEFAYRDTRLEKATAPGGRSIAFAYENGRLAAVAQDGVAFVELSYAKGALAGMKVNGVKVSLEIKEIPVVTLPETLGAKPAVTRRPALAAWAVGELAAETFSYNDSGWLCGMARDRATVAFKLHAETPARRQEALAARVAVEAAAAKAAAARKAGAKNLG